MPVFESRHPLVKHKITLLRDKRTSPYQFRQLVGELCALVGYEATIDLSLKPKAVTTPLVDTTGCETSDVVGLVPVLRAGIGMVDPFLSMLPNAQVWHLGMYRDPKTLAPVSYYNKFPQEVTCSKAYVLDPMLATGGTAVAALSTVKEWGCSNVSLVCLLASPEGIKAVEAEHPDVKIYLAHVDERLNEKGYILPGLGDAGDRIFSTEKTH